MLVGLQDPKGQRFPSQVDIGMCPKKVLHPFPGERAGELTTTAAQQINVVCVALLERNCSLVCLHLNGITLVYFSLAETGMSVFPTF